MRFVRIHPPDEASGPRCTCLHEFTKERLCNLQRSYDWKPPLVQGQLSQKTATLSSAIGFVTCTKHQRRYQQLPAKDKDKEKYADGEGSVHSSSGVVQTHREQGLSWRAIANQVG